ncbi:MAG: hypothetical protein GXP29_06905 [Planctomycetes bacterium]|nr:hypothetical protein [Planctomycetota bacterium]
MNRTEIIIRISKINHSAGLDFLQQFHTKDLAAYLDKLQSIPAEPFSITD